MEVIELLDFLALAISAICIFRQKPISLSIKTQKNPLLKTCENTSLEQRNQSLQKINFLYR